MVMVEEVDLPGKESVVHVGFKNSLKADVNLRERQFHDDIWF
jgi:hypothetical protein